MKNYLIILFCVLQGCNSVAQSDSLCEKYRVTAAELALEYQLYSDTTKLDSALYYTELALSCCPHKHIPNLILRKLAYLTFMHNYDAGIELIPTLDNPFFYYIPYYNSVLLKRFYAMKSLYEGDTATCNQYVHSILEEITPFTAEHQATIDSLCKNDLSTIFQDSLFSLCFAQMQYYYYKFYIEGADVLSQELDLLRQKGYDLEYIEYIQLGIKEEDFLYFYMY